MKRILRAVTFLLFAAGNNLSAPLSNPLPGANNGTPPVQGEKNPPVKTVSCYWSSTNEIESTRLVEENAIKTALYDAVISGKGVVRAKMDCSTIEGDPLPVYATAKGGRMNITYDYSRDRWMRFTGLMKFFGSNSYSTRKVEIGYLAQGKFIPLSGAVPKDRRLFLRLKGKEYF